MRGNDAFSPSYKARKWAHGLLMNGRKEKQGGGGKRGMKAGWRRKKWRKEKLGRVSERERREKSLVNGTLRRGRLNCHFVSKEKDTWLYRVQRSWKKDRKSSRAFDVQLLPMENAFSRYRAVHSDHETFMLARR